MILTCGGQNVTINTVSKHLKLSIIDTIAFIKKQKRHFFIDGFKVKIEKPFAEKMEDSCKKVGYGNNMSIKYNYIYDGETMLFSKTLREIAIISGKAERAVRGAHVLSEHYFISGKFLISNKDYRGQEHKIKLCAHDGERYHFGMLPEIKRNTGLKASAKNISGQLQRNNIYRKNGVTIWKN